MQEKVKGYIDEFKNVVKSLDYEVLMVAYLTEDLEEVGTIWLSDKNNFVNVPTRKVLSYIIQDENIFNILVFHNHVNGRNSLPSEADINMAYTLNFLCVFLDANLLDFIITDESEWFSFQENGILEMGQ